MDHLLLSSHVLLARCWFYPYFTEVKLGAGTGQGCQAAKWWGESCAASRALESLTLYTTQLYFPLATESDFRFTLPQNTILPIAFSATASPSSPSLKHSYITLRAQLNCCLVSVAVFHTGLFQKNSLLPC